MRKIFSAQKTGSETQDTLIESFSALANNYIDGKSNTQEYKEANRLFSETFMRECYAAIPNVDVSTFSMEQTLKNPNVHSDLFFLHRFDTILSEIIQPIVPTVIAAGYEDLYDVQAVGWGDNAKYRVNSNELFVVNDSAMGIARGGVMTEYDTEYTVTAHPKEVSCYVDLIYMDRILCEK